MKFIQLAGIVGLSLTLATPLAVRAQPGEVMLVVPHAAGTGVDAVARSFSPALQTALKVPVVVDNRVGANGAIGSSSVARAKPDGAVLMLNANPPFVTFPLTQSPPLYDAVKDFTPIAKVGSVPMVLVVSSQSEIKTFDQFITFVKANPAKAQYASPGVGSAGYLAMERLKTSKGVNMDEVLYKSTPQSLVDVAGGHILSAFASLPAVTTLVESGKLRALAVGSGARVDLMPNVPTLAELTGDEDFNASVWYGFLGPAGMPQATVDRLYESIATALRSDAVQQSLKGQGILPGIQAPKDFQRSLAQDQESARQAMKVAR
ncbi:tripartite tricarboxylate transporter substrate binding protein [Hydrogenophaga sp.]|uniref:Bug family tripartite tricarboxylate transporter substrate binding protein n=1 Tax=Hydrogenophaga sp. TaxID=1904254 RepID=UPI00271C5E25|nr:tripartite tricarboxylate transporter substrate binding protein [Hydrogenophaga sp.]MDO9438595.1 tripartite tricarboxylate transporter substrate binding protein [Hydrogenophaga sp.]